MRSLFAKIFLWFWLAIMLVAGTAVVVAVWLRSRPEGEEAHGRVIANYVLTWQGRTAVETLERDGRDALRELLARWAVPGGPRAYFFDDRGEELGGQRAPPELADLAARVGRSGEMEAQRAGDMALAAARVSDSAGRHYVIAREISPGMPEFPSLTEPAGPSKRPPFDSPGPPRGDHRGPPPDAGRESPPDGLRKPPPHDSHGPPGGRSPPGLSPRRPFPPPGPLGLLLAQPDWLALILLSVVLVGGGVCYALARYLTNPLRRLRTATRKLADGDLAARVGAAVARRRDEIGGLGRDFDFMAERLEALLAAQQRLLRDISHELRSPLARLNVALDIARRHAGANVQTGDALDRIERESGRLNELIGQLLLLARLESGAPDGQKIAVDLAQMLQEIAADADFEARGRNCRVRVAACEPCMTHGLPHMLRSAVENVVRNAVRYTAEPSDVELALRRNAAVRPEAPELPHAAELDGWAVLTVRDHGPGVPETALSDIFRPFYRLDDARDRQTGGTGLGLAITARAVEAHGGQVRAANAPGGGLQVEIRLPLVGEG